MSGVTFRLGNGVFGVAWDVDTIDVLFIASGKSSGRVTGCDDDADTRFSDIVFRIFFPASFV